MSKNGLLEIEVNNSFVIRLKSFDLTFDGCFYVIVDSLHSSCLKPFGIGPLYEYMEADYRAVPTVNRDHALLQPNENIYGDIPRH